MTDDDNTTVISETVKRFTGREIKVVVMNNKREKQRKLLKFLKKSLILLKRRE